MICARMVRTRRDLAGVVKAKESCLTLCNVYIIAGKAVECRERRAHIDAMLESRFC
jgi:hypothetical protein